MSNFNELYEKPTIVSEDNLATGDSVNEINNLIDSSFDKVESAIGNIHNLRTSPQVIDDDQFYINSIGSTIGNIQLISPEKPFNTTFIDYIQNFTTAGKEYVLDLIPNISNTITINPSVGSLTYIRVANKEDLLNDTHYVVNGRQLIFYKPPEVSFEIVYTGKFPEHEGGLYDGYMPNIYPDPALIESDPDYRPLISPLSANRYKITFNKSNIDRHGELYGSQLTMSFSPIIAPYVSSTSFIPAPQEHVGVWVKRESNTVYRRVDTSNIYLISNTEIEFETDEEIDYAEDNIIIVINNITIADALNSIHGLLLNHNHDEVSNTPLIPHSKLFGLIPTSDNPEIIYGGSAIQGNDHPQYFNREGYRDSDPGTYNNAILGDVLIGSTSSTSLFNNIEENSNKLIFGSTIQGVSLRYSSGSEGLEVFSGQNGIDIKSNDGAGADGKHSFGLRLNGHEMFEYNDSGVSWLNIGSKFKKTRFTNIDGDELADIELRDISAETGSISDNLSILDQAFIGIGGYKINPMPNPPTGYNVVLPSQTNGIFIEGEHGDDYGLFIEPGIKIFGKSNLLNAEILNGTISGNLSLKDSARIGLGTTEFDDDYLQVREIIYGTTSENTLELIARSPFRISNTGKRTGFAFGSTIENEYFSLYASSQTGDDSTPTNNDIYAEINNGAFYLLKTTQQDHIQDDRVYRWQNGTPDERIDSLKEWPRASLYGDVGNFRSIKLGLSDNVNKKGVQFGDFNSIYVTGPDSGCTTGFLALESQSGVVLVQSNSDPIDCQNLAYQSLTTGDIQAFGNIIVQRDISAGEKLIVVGKTTLGETEIGDDLTVEGAFRVKNNVNIEGELTVQGETQFKDNIIVNTNLDIKNKLTTSLLISEGVAEFRELARFLQDVSFSRDLQVAGSARIDGQMIVNNRFVGQEVTGDEGTFNSMVVSGRFEAKSGAEFIGNVSVSGNISTSQTISAAGSIFTEDHISANSLTTAEDASIQGNLFIEKNITANRNITFADVNGIFSCNTENRFSGETIFNNTVNVYGEINTLAQANISGPMLVQQMTVGGTSTFNNTSTFNGILQAQNIEAQILKGYNNTFVDQSVFTGQTTFNGQTTIAGIANVTGQFTVQSMLANGSIDVSQNVTVGNNLTALDGSITNLDTVFITGPTVLTEDAQLTANAGVTFNGDVSVASAGSTVNIQGSTNFGGTVIMAGTNTLTGPTSVTGVLSASSINMSGALSVDQNAYIEGQLTVNSDANVQRLTVEEDIASNGSLLVREQATIEGDFSMSTVNSTMSISGKSRFSGAAEFSGGLTAFGAMSVQGAFSVTSVATFASGISCGGSGTFAGGLSSGGSISGTSLNISDIAQIAGELIVSGIIRGDSIRGTDIDVGGIIKGASLEVASSINAGFGSTSTLHNIVSGGDIIHNGELFKTSGQLLVVGDAEFRGTTTSQGNFVVNPDNRPISIGTGEITIGEEGDRGRLYVGDVYADEFIGQKFISVPVDIQDSNPEVAVSLTNNKFVKTDNMFVQDMFFVSGTGVFPNTVYLNSIIKIKRSATDDDAINIVAREAYYSDQTSTTTQFGKF